MSTTTGSPDPSPEPNPSVCKEPHPASVWNSGTSLTFKMQDLIPHPQPLLRPISSSVPCDNEKQLGTICNCAVSALKALGLHCPSPPPPWLPWSQETSGGRFCLPLGSPEQVVPLLSCTAEPLQPCPNLGSHMITKVETDKWPDGSQLAILSEHFPFPTGTSVQKEARPCL
jgi:hypothetical protein